MASEIRVDKINSLSGVGTVTLSPTGVDIAGITTAATLRATTGIVTSLTSGSLTSLGAVSGTTGTFSGAVSGTTGTFTGDVDIADKIVHTGDTNTAIRFPSADTIQFETSGSARLKIDDNGKILVATTTTSEANANNDELIIGSSSDDANHGLTIVTPNDHYGTVAFSDGSGGTGQGLLEYNHSGDYMRIYTAASERLRISSTGQLSVNTTADITGVNVAIGGSVRLVNATGQSATISALPSGTYNTGVSGGSAIVFHRFSDSGGGSDEIAFETHHQGTRHGEAARFNKSGNLAFPNGQGIDFSATSGSGTSELFHDYEEGSWTPNIQGSGSNNSKTYSYQTGLYTKVGNKVTARFRIKWTSYTSDSGNAIVNGLPFTVNDGSVATGSFAGNNLNFPSSNHVTSALEVENGDTYMYILNTYDNAVWINSQASTFWQSTGEIRGEMTYFTNS